MVWGIYTNDYQPSPPAYGYSQVSKYLEPDYVGGQVPPITFTYNPFTAVINMNDGIVQARGPYVTTQQIINFVNQNNI